MGTRKLLVGLLVMVFVMGVVGLQACRPADPVADNGEPEDVQEIVIAITRDPETLDPAHLTWTSAHGVTNNIFNGLVRWETGTLEIVPDLAYDWDISEDGKVYTFYLHEGVQWHGGYGELTADDDVAASPARFPRPHLWHGSSGAGFVQQDSVGVEDIAAGRHRCRGHRHRPWVRRYGTL